MGKINNYTVDPVNPGDKILASDATTGDTKNVSAQSILNLQQSSSIYRAYLTQSSTSAPVATVVPGNTITGTWAYTSVGVYTFTSTGTFASVKTGCVLGLSNSSVNTFSFTVSGNNAVILRTYVSGTLTDAVLSDLYIEIFTHDL